MKPETKEKIRKVMDVTVTIFKGIVLASLLITAVMLYRIGSIYVANDILIVVGIYTIHNKIDKMEGR